MSVFLNLDEFLNSMEADYGLTDKARSLIAAIPGDEDAAFKYFADIVIPSSTKTKIDFKKEPKIENDLTPFCVENVQAARSYRAMNLLKQDLSSRFPKVLIKNPAQAGLLAKDLFVGLSVTDRRSYSTVHMRELLDALVESFPENVMAAAAAGGKRGIEKHMIPLLSSGQTLPVLTNLVCYGCTGRKGIASAEKSAVHTAQIYQRFQVQQIGMGHRKKFVRACMDFELMNRLADGLMSAESGLPAEHGEEACEAILTIIELIGYPHDDEPAKYQKGGKKDEIVVGEDILLSPLGTTQWWQKLLGRLLQHTCTVQQRLAISRTCMQAFALSTGNSSRICKSRAPATDATEQSSEQIVVEKEEHLTNRIVEWGLTDKIHAALVSQVPLLVQALRLPEQNVMQFNATFPTRNRANSDEASVDRASSDEASLHTLVRHPGKYQTIPIGSWRLHLLALLKEILVYRRGGTNISDGPSSSVVALDAVMKLPMSPEFTKPPKEREVKDAQEGNMAIFNPWPALCSFIWGYPHNDMYNIIFLDMFRSAVSEHHEATLRVVLQKCKFLSKAVKTVSTMSPLRGVLLNCLNLLRLRAQSLPPSSFLPQYLISHDGWKEHIGAIVQMTILQQTSMKRNTSLPRIGLGSNYAQELGLGSMEVYDALAWDDSKKVAEADKCLERNNSGKKKNKKKKR